ncbi:hypothetical protein [Seonamhaeicola maritimus]|uniref:Uncharacterized protein n=1 Tax=Seonamhaeicola maritimus TaxID=2591822 RepID=A0A5C7GNH3_9FLAO|nr:hypothetical protein [Seonamhaeicola maritimus]TXG39511.1 hypothetical protein FUA22_06475 [Seonamhaeicola maritimus]
MIKKLPYLFLVLLISFSGYSQNYPFSLPANMEATINITSSSKEVYNNLLLGTNTHNFTTTTEKDLVNKLKPITIRFPHGLWSNWRCDVMRLFGTESIYYN